MTRQNDVHRFRTRRDFLGASARWSIAPLAASVSGCFVSSTGCIQRQSNANELQPIRTWGRLGLSDGRFQRPRALAIDRNNEIYVVDKTGRIQVFSTAGDYLRGWRTPEIANGKPTGLSIDNSGHVVVLDTHYFRVLFYAADGEPIPEKTLGGSFGPEPGQMAFVTDCVQAVDGTYFVSEYGQYDRLQKWSAEGQFLSSFGTHGASELQFSRPQSLALDDSGCLWIADACNHRIMVVDWTGTEPVFIKTIGEQGALPGQFRYPYGIMLGARDTIYVAEYGGHRVQQLHRDGTFIKSWGTPGRAIGQFDAPWSVAQDSAGLLYVVDSGNNRVQCFREN